MGLPEIAHAIRKELTVEDSKKAAKKYGLSYFYFTQKIKAIDTKDEDLLRAVDCMLEAHNERNCRVQSLYQNFLNIINTKN